MSFPELVARKCTAEDADPSKFAMFLPPGHDPKAGAVAGINMTMPGTGGQVAAIGGGNQQHGCVGETDTKMLRELFVSLPSICQEMELQSFLVRAHAYTSHFLTAAWFLMLALPCKSF
eukprot:COSAG05_NODE_172_length_14980_cov_10.662791_8_plen_118_part_00